jgi:hypothetical protein
LVDKPDTEKCDRPLPRGDLTVAAASRFAFALAAIAIVLSIILGRAFLRIAVLSAALQLFYSLWAKDQVIIDIIAVAIGFVLRAFAGGVATNVEVSPWLVFITFVLALFLVLARPRHCASQRALEIPGLRRSASRSAMSLRTHPALASARNATNAMIASTTSCNTNRRAEYQGRRHQRVLDPSMGPRQTDHRTPLAEALTDIQLGRCTHRISWCWISILRFRPILGPDTRRFTKTRSSNVLSVT